MPPPEERVMSSPQSRGPLAGLGVEEWVIVIQDFLLGSGAPPRGEVGGGGGGGTNPTAPRRPSRAARRAAAALSGAPPAISNGGGVPPPRENRPLAQPTAAGQNARKRKSPDESGTPNPHTHTAYTPLLDPALAPLLAATRWLRVVARHAALSPRETRKGAAERWSDWGVSSRFPNLRGGPAGVGRPCFSSPAHAGKHSVVFRCILGQPDPAAGTPGGRQTPASQPEVLAVKLPRGGVAASAGCAGHYAREIRALRLCNPEGVGPALHPLSTEARVLLEWCGGGLPVAAFLEASGAGACADAVVAELLGQCRTLDRLGIVKSEGTHPERHILVFPGKGVGGVFPARVLLLDFDRAAVHDAPVFRNVTQCVQFLCSQRVARLLGLRSDDVALLRQLAKGYSTAPSDSTLEPILCALKSSR